MLDAKKESMLTVELVRLVGERERRAYASKDLVVRVNSIAHDGHTLICTVHQQRKHVFSKPLDTTAMVTMAENVLAPLLTGGFTPMISAIDHAHAEELRKKFDGPDVLDPVGLISALRDAGQPFPRIMRVGTDEGPVMVLPFWRRALGFLAV